MNFKLDPEFELRLTDAFFELGQAVLLSANLKFTIEKAAIIPSKLYQAKFDCESICSLSKSLFGFFQFQNVSSLGFDLGMTQKTAPETNSSPFKHILPHLIAYFESNVKTAAKAKHDFVPKFISLLANYLSRQNLFDESLSETIDQTTDKSELGFLIECLSKQKLITQLLRAFGEPKYQSSSLNKKMIEYVGQKLDELDKMIESGHLLVDSIESYAQIFIAAPFILQACDKTGVQLARVAQSLLTFQLKYLEGSADDLETGAFLLSLSVWSLMVTKNGRAFFAQMFKQSGQAGFLDNLVDLLSKTEDRVRRLRADKDLSFMKLDKSLKHQLRTLNHVMTAAKLIKDGMGRFKEVTKPVTDMLEWQLASPYHEASVQRLFIPTFSCF